MPSKKSKTDTKDIANNCTILENDDTSTSNWVNILWVYFDVSDTCKRWPAAVLKGGQLIYVGRPGVEVAGNSFDVMYEFLGTVEDVEMQTSNYKESSILNNAIELAMEVHRRIHDLKEASSGGLSPSPSSSYSSSLGHDKRQREGLSWQKEYAYNISTVSVDS